MEIQGHTFAVCWDQSKVRYICINCKHEVEPASLAWSISQNKWIPFGEINPRDVDLSKWVSISCQTQTKKNMAV